MAKLKQKIAKLEDVEEPLRSLYVAKDGAFVLDAETDPELAKLDEFRENNRKMKAQIDAWAALGMTADQIKAKLAEADKAGDAKLSASELEAKYKKQVEEAQAAAKKQADALQAKIDRYELVEPMRQAAIAAGMIPADIADVLELPSVRSRYKRGENGSIQILKADGTPDLSATPQSFFTEMRKERPRFFEPIKPGGSGQKPNDAKTGPAPEKTVAADSLNESVASGAVSLEDLASGKVAVTEAQQ